MKTIYFIIASIIGSGIGSFLYKNATNTNLHPIMIAVISLITYACLLPLAFIFMKVNTTITIPGVLFAVGTAIFLCMGTLGISFALQAGEPVGKVAALTSLYPALTLVLSCIFLGETITIRKVIGVVLAIVAVAILA